MAILLVVISHVKGQGSSFQGRILKVARVHGAVPTAGKGTDAMGARTVGEKGDHVVDLRSQTYDRHKMDTVVLGSPAKLRAVQPSVGQVAITPSSRVLHVGHPATTESCGLGDSGIIGCVPTERQGEEHEEDQKEREDKKDGDAGKSERGESTEANEPDGITVQENVDCGSEDGETNQELRKI